MKCVTKQGLISILHCASLLDPSQNVMNQIHSNLDTQFKSGTLHDFRCKKKLINVIVSKEIYLPVISF